ncbi:hypothetical protein [Methylobacterium sp. NEAU K]|uniref:hypothetical protein n=1 Tax=Methylobacterium sp. NEAU K TaxID=3064946 RepID=UPI0027352EDC|nr:hypothetical protein [Methylobacterium sp. NEAU K]MDP4005162.1 hypothetical protein [Methylobacterium sp. NEAU K]
MARNLIAQDDARENRLVDIFNLVRPARRVRHGVDAVLVVDGQEIEFELKSVTTARGSISTVRDLGRDHIEKWANKHWIVAFFDGTDPLRCRYGSPTAVAPWIDRIWDYIKRDFELAELAPGELSIETMFSILGRKDHYTALDARKLHKMQYSAAKYKELMDMDGGYSPERMLEIFRARLKYVIERGSTLNNPHINPSDYLAWPEISRDYAVTLRRLVTEWIHATPARPIAPADRP